MVLDPAHLCHIGDDIRLRNAEKLFRNDRNLTWTDINRSDILNLNMGQMLGISENLLKAALPSPNGHQITVAFDPRPPSFFAERKGHHEE